MIKLKTLPTFCIINHTPFTWPTHIIDFQDIFTDETNALLAAHSDLIAQAADHVAKRFYEVLLNHDHAHTFLNEEVVQQRLMQAQKQWIIETLAPHTVDEKDAFEARQAHIGQVHARIELPLQLMTLGVRLQKRAFIEILFDDAADAAHNDAHIQLYPSTRYWTMPRTS
ncbi:protoglobin domain-containing protein [Sulfurivirga caldicuralii]|uniref:protoglobin domain-containing protein n=1 Tax=Sulfurivirga caldicuralii TaxID=364032 RepID=UPI000A06C7F6